MRAVKAIFRLIAIKVLTSEEQAMIKSDGKRHRHLQTATTDGVFSWVMAEAEERGWSPSTVIHYYLSQAKMQSEDNSYLIREMEQREAYRTYKSYNEKSPVGATTELDIQNLRGK
ncbi:hypothetical protein ABEF81_08785 [Acinetobacter thermotolerans]|uniref:hypothetical protein n=1 Tax=Acinetobacter thermotolerans TaxID=3151487 RepID=UPI00325A8CB0